VAGHPCLQELVGARDALTANHSSMMRNFENPLQTACHKKTLQPTHNLINYTFLFAIFSSGRLPMIRLTQKTTSFNCHFQNKRPKQLAEGRCCSAQESHCHLVETSGRLVSGQLIHRKMMLFCLIACSCWAMTAQSADGKSRTKLPAVEQVKSLRTSDGVPLQLVYYPPQGKATATVILVHDIGGSEKTVRKLAAGLQKAGCAVAVPDLRGHGGSKNADLDVSKKRLFVNQLRMIPASGGGRIRTSANLKGDLETVRNWLVEKEAEGDIDLKQLCVIGSGLGGTLAATWAVADWNWLPNTQGPQGQQVQTVILISPVWADQGISITNALGVRTTSGQREVKPLLEYLPVMIIAGSNDRQSSQLFQRLKGARPTSWFKESANGTKEQSKKKLSPNQPKTGPLVFEEIRSSLRADKLASLPSGNRTPLQLCAWFISETLSGNN
jgi:pimeloyl-ACP methyl ester carboxylesterase